MLAGGARDGRSWGSNKSRWANGAANRRWDIYKVAHQRGLELLLQKTADLFCSSCRSIMYYIISCNWSFCFIHHHILPVAVDVHQYLWILPEELEFVVRIRIKKTVFMLSFQPICSSSSAEGGSLESVMSTSVSSSSSAEAARKKLFADMSLL